MESKVPFFFLFFYIPQRVFWREKEYYVIRMVIALCGDTEILKNFVVSGFL